MGTELTDRLTEGREREERKEGRKESSLKKRSVWPAGAGGTPARRGGRQLSDAPAVDASNGERNEFDPGR